MFLRHSRPRLPLVVLACAAVLASCGRPTDTSDDDASCKVQFAVTNAVASGDLLTLTVAMPASCVAFLTSGSGPVSLKLVAEPAGGAILCPGRVVLGGIAAPAPLDSTDATCDDRSITQMATTPWTRPLSPSPTSVQLTLRSKDGPAAATQLAQASLELSGR